MIGKQNARKILQFLNPEVVGIQFNSNLKKKKFNLLDP